MTTFKKTTQDILTSLGFKIIVSDAAPTHPIGKWIRQRADAPLFNTAEFRHLVSKMDSGNFDFDSQTVQKMLKQWRASPKLAPYPTRISRAFEDYDAVESNQVDVLELVYRLPYALAYEAVEKEKYHNIIRIAQEHGIAFDDGEIIDVGCGLGGLLVEVSKKYPSTRLIGVECAQSAIDWIAKNRPFIEGFVANIENSSIKDGHAFKGVKADVVFNTEVLEHLQYPDQALANLISLKKDDGAVIITVPNGRIDTAPHHINFWSPESWHSFIKRNTEGHQYTVGKCPNPQAPSQFENFAIIT